MLALLVCAGALAADTIARPGTAPPREHLEQMPGFGDDVYNVAIDAEGLPVPYGVDDPGADHRAHAIAMDRAGRPGAALASFRAAVRWAEQGLSGGVELSGAYFNLGLALADHRGTREEQRRALRAAVKADPLNADAAEALAEVGEAEPPGLAALRIRRVPWSVFAGSVFAGGGGAEGGGGTEGGGGAEGAEGGTATGDRAVYEAGRVPFVLVMGNGTVRGSAGAVVGAPPPPPQPPTWAAVGNWSVAALAAAFPGEIVDHYPQSMGVSTNRPFLRTWEEAAQLFLEEGNGGEAGGGAGRVDADAPPQYIQWRVREGAWARLRRDVTPLPPFWDESQWAPQCLPPPRRLAGGLVDDAADNLFAHSRWRVAVVGNAGSGMFLHADAFASATWQAQIVGRKKWVLCHPDSRRLSTDVDLFAQEAPPAVADAAQHDRCGVITLHPGEILLYPAGWWHQTLSLDTPTISLAHRVVDVRRWSSMAAYWRMACRNPGIDVEKDFPGAAPLLKPAVCDAIDGCEDAWRAHFGEGDGFITGLGEEP
jgi:hypothetical protein